MLEQLKLLSQELEESFDNWLKVTGDIGLLNMKVSYFQVFLMLVYLYDFISYDLLRLLQYGQAEFRHSMRIVSCRKLDLGLPFMFT